MFFEKIDHLLKALKLKLKLNKHNSISVNVKIEIPFSLNFYENVTIEDYCYFGPNTVIDSRGGLHIKKGTILGPNVTIYTANHNYNSEKLIPYDKEWVYKKVVIGECAWIGGGVSILPGSKIGKGCIISAGSVVRGNLEDYHIYAGNPATKVGKRDEKTFDRLSFDDKIYMKYKRSNS